MWSDNEASLDLLGYKHLVRAARTILDEDRLLPATLGVFGDWGSGKSTLIRMVCEELKSDKETLVLSFNGWLFEGYEDAKLALMGTIIDELAEKKTLTAKGKDLVLKLVRRINVWKLTGAGLRAAAGFAVAGPAGAAAGALFDPTTLIEKAKGIEPKDIGQFLRDNDPGQQLRRGVREFREDFTELLADTKVKRLVVIVDDLDRCTPDTVIETLEAIKLFLFVPHTAFVIGADERLIRYAVRRRFPELPGERAEVGRDYLEKLIQFPIRIPAMGHGETEAYIKLLLAERCILKKGDYERLRACVADAGIDITLDRLSVEKALGSKPAQDLDEALTLGDQIAPVLTSGLAGNPRQCKRFLNTLLMRLAMATSRNVPLKRRVLAKLMLLEYMKPDSFRELARTQAAQAGRPVDLAALEAPSIVEDKGEEGTDEKPSAAAKPLKISDKPPSKPQLRADAPATGALAGWMTDPWTVEWVKSSPALANEDLRPYFYFSREALDPLAGLALRMSPEAQTALAKILGPSVGERTLAISRAVSLSPADAAAVFEALTRKAREAEALAGSDSPFARMLEWVGVRHELFGELMTFLKSLPELTVPFGFPPQIAQLSTAERKPQIIQLLGHWKTHGSDRLKQTSATAIQQLNK